MTPQVRIDFEGRRAAAGISYSQFARETGITLTSLRRKLANPGQFTLNEAERMHEVLNRLERAA